VGLGIQGRVGGEGGLGGGGRLAELIDVDLRIARLELLARRGGDGVEGGAGAGDRAAGDDGVSGEFGHVFNPLAVSTERGSRRRS
jgi:hypothetical protein